MPRKARHATGDAELKIAVEENNGFFLARSALGNRFDNKKRTDPEFLKDYEEAPNKEVFKADWAKMEYKGKQHNMKNNTEAWKESWGRKGKPVSFLRMLYEEGGPAGHQDPQTIRECKIQCEKCLDMGYPWVQVSKMHGGTKYMWFDDVYKENFEQEWQTTTSQNEEEDGVPQQGAGVPQQGAGVPPPPPPPPPVPKAVKPAVKALAAANKCALGAKAILSSASSQAEDMTTDAKWEWANSDVVLGRLKREQVKVEAALKTSELGKLLMCGSEPSEAGGEEEVEVGRRRWER